MLRLKVYTTSPSPDFQDSYTTLSFKRCTEQQQCEISVCVCVWGGGGCVQSLSCWGQDIKKTFSILKKAIKI